MGSNLIIISISKKFKVSSKKLYDSDKLIKNKPKMSLKNLDEEFFSLLVQNKINLISFDPEMKDPFNLWYTIMNCSLRAEAIIYDGIGNKKTYHKNKIINNL